jgi:HPt (histidine-containing phosphotransfer) domain-containing protein
MDALRARFAARLRHDALELAALAAELSAGGVEEARLQRMRMLAHRLHGSAGAFGRPRIGEAASRLEDAVGAALAKDRARDDADRIRAVQAALGRLRTNLLQETG